MLTGEILAVKPDPLFPSNNFFSILHCSSTLTSLLDRQMMLVNLNGARSEEFTRSLKYTVPTDQYGTSRVPTISMHRVLKSLLTVA